MLRCHADNLSKNSAHKNLVPPHNTALTLPSSEFFNKPNFEFFFCQSENYLRKHEFQNKRLILKNSQALLCLFQLETEEHTYPFVFQNWLQRLHLSLLVGLIGSAWLCIFLNRNVFLSRFQRDVPGLLTVIFQQREIHWNCLYQLYLPNVPNQSVSKVKLCASLIIKLW